LKKDKYDHDDVIQKN